MQIQLEHPSTIRVDVEVTIEPSEISSVRNQVIREVKKQARIPGFRAGKIPTNLVLRHYGPTVDARALERLLDTYVPKALAEADIHPVSQPRLRDELGKVSPNEPFAFVIECDVMPSLDPVGYDSLDVPDTEVNVTEEEIAERIASIQKTHAEAVPVEEKSPEMGNRVEFSYYGRAGEQDIPEDAPLKAQAELGDTQLLPNLQDALLNAEVNTPFEVEFEYPEDFTEEGLRGQSAALTVTVDAIYKIEYPELDDEFAKSEGFDTLDELRAEVEKHLLAHRTQEARNERVEKAYDALLEKNPFEVPQSVVDNYAQTLSQYMGQSMMHRGVPGETAQQVVQDSVTEAQKVAERQVRIEHMLHSIQKKTDLSVTDDDFESAMEKEAEQTGSPIPRIKAKYNAPERKRQLEVRVLREKTIALLLGEDNEPVVEDTSTSDSEPEAVEPEETQEQPAEETTA